MIFVDGLPFSSPQGKDILLALLENPILVSVSSSLKAKSERKFSVSDESSSERSKWVYIFQREYATVDPALVDFVGTDEATTCVGLVIRNQKNGMTSVAHMDSPKIVETGLSQMLSSLVDNSLETEFDVHLIGGFEDFSLQVWPWSSAFMLMVAQYQKALQIWMVIPFLCVQRLFMLYGQERRSFTSELSVFLDIIPEEILMESHTPFSMDLWWRQQQELSTQLFLIELLDVQMKLSEEYEYLLLMKMPTGMGSY